MSFSRHSTVCAAAGSSNRASPTAAVAILEEKIEEKELHVEASESYLAVSSKHVIALYTLGPLSVPLLHTY